MAKKKWFKQAVMDKPPYTLGGWSKNQPPGMRREKALESRPKNWGAKRRRLSAGRGLQALANVTRDKMTRVLAKRDAQYFFKQARKGGD